MRGNTTIAVNIAAPVEFRNCASFSKCITKMNGAKIDATKDLVITLYNLLKFNSNYFDTIGSLWVYSKDEATNFNADNTYSNI